MITPYESTWDYKAFVYRQWPQNLTWTCLADDDLYVALQARQYFWDTCEEQIEFEIRQWLAEGWQPVEFVGATAIRLDKTEIMTDMIQLSDILLWIITLGAALIVRLLVGGPRTVITYRPVEFRVRMQRVRHPESPETLIREPLYAEMVG